MRIGRTWAALGAIVAAGTLGCGDADDLEESAHASDALTAVPSFGSNPGQLDLYVYVPAGLPAGAPLVVALHGCTQTASDYTRAGWNDLADDWGFAVAYPQQRTANNSNRCFNWFEPGDIARGSGEAKSIASMVGKLVDTYDLDPEHVFVTGLSAGGAMTSVLLATYPDVFAAGAVMAGIPYGCAKSVGAAFGCMSPGSSLSAAAWADKVFLASSGVTDVYPRVSIWHGTKDATVAPANADAQVLQWTAVHDTDATADDVEPLGSATRSVYLDDDGRVVVEKIMIGGMGHGTAVDPGTDTGACGSAGAYILDVGICSTHHAGRFFGLDPAETPPVEEPPPDDPGGDDPPPDDPPPPPDPTACEAFYDANYYHVEEGRAVRCGVGGSYVCAIGSGVQLGLWNMMKTWVRETSPGYFEPGEC